MISLEGRRATGLHHTLLLSGEEILASLSRERGEIARTDPTCSRSLLYCVIQTCGGSTFGHHAQEAALILSFRRQHRQNDAMPRARTTGVIRTEGGSLHVDDDRARHDNALYETDSTARKWAPWTDGRRTMHPAD